MKKLFFILVLTFGIWFMGNANNVRIDSLLIINDSTLSFKVSWENSWNVNTPPSNHDAVWIFAKRAECSQPHVWYHQDVSMNPADHSVEAPLEVYMDGYNAAGIFVRRSAAGFGNIDDVKVTLMMTGIPAANFNFEVFAVEMVYINEGPFYLGDESSGHRLNLSANPYTGAAYQVTSEAAITTTSSSTDAGKLYASRPAGYSPQLPIPTIPDTFPKGYAAFYAMKYETSQQQITDFFNHLSQTAYNRYVGRIPDEPAYGQDITNTTWLNFSTADPFRPVYARATYASSTAGTGDYKTYQLQLAFLDWSGLRPMTEFEYEKICRGPASAVNSEFAWGTASHTPFRPDTVNPDTLYFGTPSETHTITLPPGNGIAVAPTKSPPSGITGMVYRSGFSAKLGNNRTESGSSYYGVMDLTGNVEDMVIVCRLGDALNQSRTNVGDGHLVIGGSNDGYENQGWYVATSLGYPFGMKGGGIYPGTTTVLQSYYYHGQVSNRYGFSNQQYRGFHFMRGVR